MPEEDIRGTPEERETYWEVKRHYDLAREDVDARITNWDKADELFRSYINPVGWPYSAQVFDPRTFTAIFEKSARLLANKLRGRMEPREGADVIGAKVNNALLNYQWDEAERVDGSPMLAKWALMDMNARKYGASFALAKWHFEEKFIGEEKTRVTWYDGPTFQPWNNRDVLHNPSYSTIKNWIQLRDYVTLDELKRVNDTAKGKPIYKNLDILRDALTKEARGGGDQRSTNWRSKNLSLKGLNDFLGRDEVFKVFERVTEYRPDKWITFAPRYGVVIRDIPNPYFHGQIPVVQLKYYPIDEDIYGLSEIEPIEKLQRATNALICQYLDAINQSNNRILKVRIAAVQMHTLEFGPGKKWLMNDPQTDVLPLEFGGAGIAEFAQTYRFLIGAMQEALGEASVGVSNLDPTAGEKTATEIRDTSLQRNVRDNFNQMFLSEAIKDQMMFWYMMDQQLLFDKRNKQKIIRIAGQDAIDLFEAGASDYGLSQATIDMLASPEMEEAIADPAFDIASLLTPLNPVSVNNQTVAKMEMDEAGNGASVVIEPEDLSGNYDYIPEVKSMSVPDNAQITALSQAVMSAADPAKIQVRAQEGYMLKLKELEEDLFENLGLKDASKYYQKLQPQIGGINGQETGQPINGAGAGIPQGGGAAFGNVPPAGLAGASQTMAPGAG